MSLTWLYDVCFFTIKPLTFHSLTFERPRSLSKSIWIGELPWQLLWSVADTLGWMSDVHVTCCGSRWEKVCLLWKKHEKKSTMYGLKHRNALDEQVFLPPTKTASLPGRERPWRPPRPKACWKCCRNATPTWRWFKRPPVENAPKNLGFFVGDTKYPVNY